MDSSEIHFLVKVCVSANQAKDLACLLIDQNLPVIVDKMEGMSSLSIWADSRTGEAYISCEGPYWLVFSDNEAYDIIEFELNEKRLVIDNLMLKSELLHIGLSFSKLF